MQLLITTTRKGRNMGGQVLDTKKYKYKRVRVRCPDGKVIYSANNGDPVSKSMLGMDKNQLVRVMRDNKLEHRIGKHSSKNTGHFRMCLGQALRMMVTRGFPVYIDGTTIKALGQDVPWPEGYVEEPIVPRVKKKDWRSAAEDAVSIKK